MTSPRRSERGATLLEFAIVLPLLLLLAFGTVEAGMAWVTNNRVEGATSTSARIGASSGEVPEADTNILFALKSALPEDARANLDRVVIFLPANDDGAVPSGCIKNVGSINETGVNGRCNTYTGATVRSITSSTDLGARDGYWVPSARSSTLAGPPDDIGVWVRTTHDGITGALWTELTITKSSIYRIQPDP